MEGWTDGRVDGWKGGGMDGWKGGGLDGWVGQREGKAKDDGDCPFPAVPPDKEAVPSDREAEFPPIRSVPIAPS